jgi:uncharacterized alkaline shock family protein YloU
MTWFGLYQPNSKAFYHTINKASSEPGEKSMSENENKVNELGSILIRKDAIESIARQSTLQSYGVVGLAPRNLWENILQLIRKNARYGVKVEYDHDGLIIDLYIVVEYGTRIKSITNSIVSSVKYNVEKTVGLPVRRINVHVRGLRISNLD